MLWDVWVMTLLPLFSAAARTRVVTPKRFGFVDNCGFLEAGEGGHEGRGIGRGGAGKSSLGFDFNCPGSRGGRLSANLDSEQALGKFRVDLGMEALEHGEGFGFVFDQGIALTVATQTDTGAEIVDSIEMVDPEIVNG